ncbi:hypothetical protein AM588_10011705 [Phytophthora nicotianae]|uniref:phosphoribosylaminoimidazole carboxylase n=1 Tax=Phytophthora nicotianae TaxID=4792 RepID=A0A0W8DLY7_PHYNI|nr:hypothetical protein AM588_10011705 [Phytophthora nicotianae]
MTLVGVLRSRRHTLLHVAASTISGERAVPKLRVATLSTSSNSHLEDKKPILELLQRVADGKVSPQEAAELCGPAAEYEAVGDFAKIDTKREARTGFPEVVYAESKTSQQVAAIMKAMIDGGEDNVMASRDCPTACVLCAGTSDLPVAEEAAVTLGENSIALLYDVGVAGIHRLLRNQHILRASDVAICVAGMDGALPGVVGGLTSAPVIAVPTSVGYGAAFGGLAPLLTMLNACSPGVGVVNIDNGFGAAVLAESSSDSLPPGQNLHTALPIGREARVRRPKHRRKRRSSGDDVAVSRCDDSSDEEREEEEQEQEEMITISAAELEKWQQRVIAHVEDHFTNEQLKRIAEFGRVHGTIMQEARQYVGNVEMQLKRQFEEERTSLRAQAEEYVAKAEVEKESWRQKAGDLRKQVEELHKQIDKLEVENDALKMEKAQNSQSEEEQQENREQTLQTHSPPNNQTQVQPEGEVSGKVENQPAKGNGYELSGSGSLHPPLDGKQVPDGHSSVLEPTNPAPHHDIGLGKDQHQQTQVPVQQSCVSSSPVNGTTQLKPSVTQDGLLTTKTPEPRNDAGKLRAPGEDA